VVAWGDNTFGQCNVPALPTGLSYMQVAAGGSYDFWPAMYGHTVALRSDGSVVAWGDNTFGQCNVPTLPPGFNYVEVAAGGVHTLALRSDGSVVAWGNNSAGQCNVPALPSGLSYVEVAASGRYDFWQAMYDGHTVALRSDGSVVAWGDNSYGQCNVPSLPAGLRYLAVSGGAGFTAIYEAGYSSTGTGCAGSLGVPRLVPVHDARLGAVMQVNAMALPQNLAFVASGLSDTTSVFGPLPLDLTTLGMPACSLRVSPDVISMVAGASHVATITMPIPNVASLLGLRFFQQALAPDPSSNPFGAVLSNSAVAIVHG
jgi:hypothetical protein